MKSQSSATKKGDAKKVAFFTIGVITLLYCIAELGAALWLNSLALLSDGFHNLSDVVSLYIAYWAQDAARRGMSNDMSYGWARTEILGGLTNGCFLLSLCLYIALEAVPKLIHPQPIEAGYIFMIIAGVGLVVNTVGTLVFASVGLSHGHSHSHGHGHGHGGESGHGHGHSHKKGKSVEERSLLSAINDDSTSSSADDDNHSHEEEHEHEHAHEHEHEHGGHEHDHGGHDHDHGGHEHDHDHKKKKDKKHDHKKTLHTEPLHKKEKHEHKHGKDKKKKKKEEGMFAHVDVNMWAVFIHYLGDAVSSVFVLATGVLLHFFTEKWTLYVDPISSLIIVSIIVVTTIPLVKRCSRILLQGVPPEIDMGSLRIQIGELDSVISVHDLHIWQLVDGMIIASVHLMVEEGGDLGNVLYHVKRIFHESGIHSSAIQPEYVKAASKETNFCAQNCVEDCEEDWCCKETADDKKLAVVASYKDV